MFDRTLPQPIQEIIAGTQNAVCIKGAFNSHQLRTLCLALRKNTVLTTLYFKGVFFTKDQWKMIFGAVLHHPTLEALGVLQSTPLELTRVFRQLIHKTPNLRHIKISRTALSDADTDLLFDSLKQSSIQYLSLCDIGCCNSVLLRNIVSLLPQSSLRCVYLPIQSLSIAQSGQFSKALLQNNTLLYLNFCEETTRIESGALQPILDVIAQKAQIEYLTLGFLEDEKDYYRLADFLSTNPSLTQLSITNELDPKMINRMTDKILGKNNTLRGFSYNCHFSGMTDRECYRFDSYRSYLDELTDKNIKPIARVDTAEPVSKKKKL